MNIDMKRHSPPLWVAQITGLDDDVVRTLNHLKDGAFWSLTRTADESSLVSPIENHETFVNSDGPWTLFEVAGVLDFDLIGILNALTQPMADAGVSVFAISTFNADYILVKAEIADLAQDVWRSTGIGVTSV
jgi:hypothetical protein